MRTIAILPMKGLGAAKQRLTGLGAGARRALAQAMFTDVLAALRRVRTLDAIAVVTADHAVEATVRAEGVSVLPDESSAGQSAAALVGVRHAVVAGFDRALLVPGDTPIIEPHEIDLMLGRAADDGTAVVIVPDRHRTGTNALVITPPDAFEPSFGPGSLDRHVSNARAAGLSHRVDPVESLLLDVDTLDDLAVLAESIDRHRVGAARTRGALRQLDRLAGVHLGGSSPPRPPTASAHGSGRRLP